MVSVSSSQQLGHGLTWLLLSPSSFGSCPCCGQPYLVSQLPNSNFLGEGYKWYSSSCQAHVAGQVTHGLFGGQVATFHPINPSQGDKMSGTVHGCCHPAQMVWSGAFEGYMDQIYICLMLSMKFGRWHAHSWASNTHILTFLIKRKDSILPQHNPLRPPYCQLSEVKMKRQESKR